MTVFPAVAHQIQQGKHLGKGVGRYPRIPFLSLQISVLPVQTVLLVEHHRVQILLVVGQVELTDQGRLIIGKKVLLGLLCLNQIVVGVFHGGLLSPGKFFSILARVMPKDN